MNKYLIVLTIIIILFATGCHKKNSGNSEITKNTNIETNIKEIGLISIKLFFADPQYYKLIPEWREIPNDNNTTTQILRIVNELIKGPESSELEASIPSQTKLISVFIQKNGVVTLNFDTGTQTALNGGSESEIFFVYSIVDSIISNFDNILSVKFLFGDKEINLLNGHLDFRFPFSFNKNIIK